MSNASTADSGALLKMTAEIVSAYLGKNPVPMAQVPEVIGTVHSALAGLGAPVQQETEELKPAVAIRKSVTPEYIVCLEDGKKLKMLKRHLRSVYNMTPDQYRARWSLPSDYPMVAPNYAAQRSSFAKQIGLGRNDRGKTAGQGGTRRKSAA
jgi:predicted transcriptional regulator